MMTLYIWTLILFLDLKVLRFLMIVIIQSQWSLSVLKVSFLLIFRYFFSYLAISLKCDDGDVQKPVIFIFTSCQPFKRQCYIMVKHTQIIRRLLQFLNDAKHFKNFKNTDDPVREQLTYVWCRITLEVKQYQL